MTDTNTPQPGAASALLRWQLRLAHRLLDGALEQLPPELIHQHPPGTAAPAGACYAQAVLSEDLLVSGALGGRQPLALTTWAGRTGLGDLPELALSSSNGLAMPISRPFAEWSSWRTWSRRVRIDLPQFRQYAQAVYAATDAYVATLPDALLDPARRELPGCLLNALLLTIATRRGEIAALVSVLRQSDAARVTSSSPSPHGDPAQRRGPMVGHDCCPVHPTGR